jgi:hypothetical protein
MTVPPRPQAPSAHGGTVAPFLILYAPAPAPRAGRPGQAALIRLSESGPRAGGEGAKVEQRFSFLIAVGTPG